jgi:hypothetical protein
MTPMIMAPCLAPSLLAPSLVPSLLAPSSLPRKRHVCVDANVDKDLGAKCSSAKTCNLGANNDGAKLRVHFLKSYSQGRVCENLSKKRLKNKKDSILFMLMTWKGS